MRAAGAVLLLLCATATALADGGRLRLHTQAGAFAVSLFTTPDPLRVGQADFSVAVERGGVDGLDDGAQVTLVLRRADGQGRPIVLQASHSAATSRFLQAADFSLPQSGTWKVEVLVKEGSETGRADCSVEVLPASLFSESLFWEVALVPFAILLFGLHQWRKRVFRRARAGTRHARIVPS